MRERSREVGADGGTDGFCAAGRQPAAAGLEVRVGTGVVSMDSPRLRVGDLASFLPFLPMSFAMMGRVVVVGGWKSGGGSDPAALGVRVGALSHLVVD